MALGARVTAGPVESLARTAAPLRRASRDDRSRPEQSPPWQECQGEHRRGHRDRARHTQSMTSSETTKADLTEAAKEASPSLSATNCPVPAPCRTSRAAASGMPLTWTWLRYSELSTVPRTATPTVAPTWRHAMMRPDPTPAAVGREPRRGRRSWWRGGRSRDRTRR